VSFSKVTQKHIDQLGITAVDKGSWLSASLKKLQEQYHSLVSEHDEGQKRLLQLLGAELDEAWLKEMDRLVANIQTVLHGIGSLV
jgi:predicted transcriptional regulator